MKIKNGAYETKLKDILDMAHQTGLYINLRYKLKKENMVNWKSIIKNNSARRGCGFGVNCKVTF